MEFSTITPADYARLTPYFQNQRHELCSYSLASILVWSNPLHHPCAAEADGALYVRTTFTDKRRKNFLFLPIHPSREYSPAELAALLPRAGVDRLGFVTDAYLKRWGKDAVREHFTIRSMAGYHDYVYVTRELAELPGNRFHKKRNLLRQFMKKYLETGRAAAEPMGPKNRAEVLDFLEAWCRERDCDQTPESSMACEKIAAQNAINNLEKLSDARGLAVRVDGEVSAFGIAARVTDTMGAMHFEKAFVRHKGLYQYLDSECARTILAPYEWTNKESDMGLAGLRQAKRSYMPARMVRSYCLLAKT
ncbi:MAG: DUF2156 domain-containing protein [Deltaproteobacteria bacterium]|nr:DUF2156 domain-containing protein [Deltaproteobacteria bacterium]